MDSSSLVGVFMPARPTESISLQTHDGEFVAALERELRGQGRSMMLRGISRPADVRSAARGLSGVVLLGFRDEEVASLPGLDADVVAVDSYAHRSDFAFVRADDIEGGRRAARYLLTWGHRVVLFVGPVKDESGVVRERSSGFTGTLSDAGLTTHAHVTTSTSHREGVSVGRSLGQRHPAVTAVFAMADTLALGIIEGIGLSGRRVPADVSVMGFDDLALASMSTPKLTCVAQDISRKAALTAEALLQPTFGNDALIVGVDIVERASVGAPA